MVALLVLSSLLQEIVGKQLVEHRLMRQVLVVCDVCCPGLKVSETDGLLVVQVIEVVSGLNIMFQSMHISFHWKLFP